MYHILPPEGQAQFGTGQTIYDVETQPPRSGHSHKLPPPVLRTVRCFDQHNGGLLRIYRTCDAVKSLNEQPGPAGKAQIVRQTTHELRLHPLRKVGDSGEGSLRRSRKVVPGNRNFKNAALSRDPESASRKGGGDVGDHAAVGVRHEADQLLFRQHLAGNDAAPLAHRLRIIGLGRTWRFRHASSCSSETASSAGCSGNSSIQPALTRAFMMMALASSVERLNDSRAPGTRTRSLSLPSS